VSVRARLITYFVVVHLALAGLGGWLVWTEPYALIGVEIALIASLAIGIGLVRRAIAYRGLAEHARRLVHDEAFTSRFLPVGEPDLDELIALYNQMVDRLRDERVRLAEQHQFLAQVIAASPSGIVVLGFDDEITSLNPAAARLLERPAAEAMGRRFTALDTPMAAALATLTNGDSRVIGVDGAHRARIQRGGFIDRGFPRAFFVIEELTGELRQAERAAYEKLIRVMSHEVNNTVASSTSLLQSSLTYARELGPESRLDFETALGVVIARTAQLNTFMKGFADVYRLPAPARQPCELVAILERVVALQSARPEAAGIDWRWDLDAPAFRVSADPAQLEQALLNIVKNAAEAVGGRGAIVVRAVSRTVRPTLTIEDSGPGLTAEAQANLFTPFFSTKPGGQGIGLTLVGEILAGHGFDYVLERTDHETTAFRIVFTPPGT
jgi:two-component system, NtrC family, nitrogen regulation sensor histidine kinase NtrY